MLEKVKTFVSSIGPGVFMIGYVIGTGSVTTMATAGARYGMSLTWALLMSCFFTAILMMVISRLTIVTHETLMYNIKIHIHKGISIFIIGALVVTIVSSIMGVTGIVVSVIQEWSKPLTREANGFHPMLSSLVIIGLLYSLFWNGRHSMFVKILSIMVGLMGVCFLLTMIMVIPEPAEVIKGLIPQIPSTGKAHLVIAGMVGTTMAGVCLVSRSTLVQEKGWTVDELKIENRDAIVSMGLTFFLSAAIIASAAGTLHPKGIHIDTAIDMVQTLEPLAGRFAISIFVSGVVCAGLSSIFPNIILLPWLICDYQKVPRNMRRPFFRFLVLIVILTGLTIPLFGGQPVSVMIASQAVSPLVMPFLTLFLLILLNKKEIIGQHTATFIMNLAMGLTMLFSIYMGFIAFKGFWGLYKIH